MKSLIEKAFFLKRVHLFQERSLELLLAIAEKLHEDEYDAGEKIFVPDQVANRIYLIAKGSVEIFRGAESLELLELGDFFGDESLFNDQSRSYTAVAKTHSLFFTLSRSQFLSIISECPTVAVSLLQMYAHRFPCRYSSQLKRSP